MSARQKQQDGRKATGRTGGPGTRKRQPAAPSGPSAGPAVPAPGDEFADPFGASGLGMVTLNEFVGRVALWEMEEPEHEAPTIYGPKLVLRARVTALYGDELAEPALCDVWPEAVRRSFRDGARVGGVLVRGDRGFYLRRLSQLEAAALRAALAFRARP